MNSRTIGLGVGAFSIGALAVTLGLRLFGRAPIMPYSPGSPAQPGSGDTSAGALTRTMASGGLGAGGEGHVPTDLVAGTDLGPDHRAPVAFRPDIDAPMTAAEREALRPATGPAPSLVADEGSGFAEAAGAA